MLSSCHEICYASRCMSRSTELESPWPRVHVIWKLGNSFLSLPSPFPSHLLLVQEITKACAGCLRCIDFHGQLKEHRPSDVLVASDGQCLPPPPPPSLSPLTPNLIPSRLTQWATHPSPGRTRSLGAPRGFPVERSRTTGYVMESSAMPRSLGMQPMPRIDNGRAAAHRGGRPRRSVTQSFLYANRGNKVCNAMEIRVIELA